MLIKRYAGCASWTGRMSANKQDASAVNPDLFISSRLSDVASLDYAYSTRFITSGDVNQRSSILLSMCGDLDNG
jgi:hypothetical protein